MGTWGRHGIRVFDLETSQFREWAFDQVVDCAGLSADGARVTSVVGDQVLTWCVDGGPAASQTLATMPDSFGHGADAAISEDAGAVLIADGRTANVWHHRHGARELRIPRREYIYASAIARDHVALVSDAGTVRRFDLSLAKGRPLRLPACGPQTPHALAISPGGGLIAVGYQEGLIRVFDAGAAPRRNSPLAEFQAHDEWVRQLKITDAGRLCSVGLDGVICLADAHDGRILARLTSENGWGSCWLCADGRTVFVTGSDGGLHRLEHRAG